jgi:hypothetical protein
LNGGNFHVEVYLKNCTIICNLSWWRAINSTFVVPVELTLHRQYAVCSI